MADVGHSRPVPPDTVSLGWGSSAVNPAEARVAGEGERSHGAYTGYVGRDTEGTLALPSSEGRIDDDDADSEVETPAFGMGMPLDCKDRLDPLPRQIDIFRGQAVHSVRWMPLGTGDTRCYILN